jgi:hypothetical protein
VSEGKRSEAQLRQLARVDPGRGVLLLTAAAAEIRTLVPNVVRLSADDAYLEWSDGGGRRPSPPLRDCLLQFSKLASAEPPQFLAFAQRWGMLYLCRCGEPLWHRPRGDSDGECGIPHAPGDETVGQLPHMPPMGFLQERVEHWRRHAEAARMVLEKAAGLLGYGGPRSEDQAHWAEWTMGRVNLWLADAGVHPTLAWPASAPRPALYLAQWEAPQDHPAPKDWPHLRVPPGYQYGNLFAILGMQLAAALTGSGGVQACKWCGEPFPGTPRERRTPGALRDFCTPECRDARRLEVKRESEHRTRKPRPAEH